MILDENCGGQDFDSWMVRCVAVRHANIMTESVMHGKKGPAAERQKKEFRIDQTCSKNRF